MLTATLSAGTSEEASFIIRRNSATGNVLITNISKLPTKVLNDISASEGRIQLEYVADPGAGVCVCVFDTLPVQVSVSDTCSGFSSFHFLRSSFFFPSLASQ